MRTLTGSVNKIERIGIGWSPTKSGRLVEQIYDPLVDRNIFLTNLVHASIYCLN